MYTFYYATILNIAMPANFIGMDPDKEKYIVLEG
jgi:hypothetical protein